MTKEELKKITDRNVGKKVLDIIFNSFKAAFEKEFGYDSLEVRIVPYWDQFSWMVRIDLDDKFELPEYFCHISITPAAWAICGIDLGYDIKENIENLRYIWAIEKLNGQNRINEFKNRCDDRNLKYDIVYKTDKLYSLISSKVAEIGKGVFKITKSMGYSRKFSFSLTFDCDTAERKTPVTLQMFFSDQNDFLECLKNFADVCKKKKLNTVREIKDELEVQPLREYRLVTKKVLCKLLREDGDHNSLQKNLGLGKFGTNLKKKLFAGNQSLEYVSLPQGMKEIPDSLFMFCENLRSVQIPESVEEIGYKAFYGCKNLKYVNLPKHLKSICSRAFAYCDSLPDLKVPEHCMVASDAFATEFDYYGESDDPYYLDSEYLNIYGDSENWY